MKKLIVLLGGCLLAARAFAEAPGAKMEKANAEILPTPYRIRVALGRELPQSKIAKSMFAIRDPQSGETIPIVSVRRVGAPDEVPDPPLKGVLLDADLNPARAYSVEISFPGG